MALFNLIGCRRHDDLTDAVPKLAEKMVNCFNLSAHKRFFVKYLIEINVNISHELNFSDVYRSVNYIRSQVKFT